MSIIDRSALIGFPPEHRDYVEGVTPNHGVALGPDVRINSFVTVDGGWKEPTRVGARTFLMTKVHIGHDAQIGEDCEIAAGATIGGHVHVGDRTKIGVNACTTTGVRIGKDCVIGAGAVVTKDVPDGEVWAGVPARKLR